MNPMVEKYLSQLDNGDASSEPFDLEPGIVRQQLEHEPSEEPGSPEDESVEAGPAAVLADEDLPEEVDDTYADANPQKGPNGEPLGSHFGIEGYGEGEGGIDAEMAQDTQGFKEWGPDYAAQQTPSGQPDDREAMKAALLERMAQHDRGSRDYQDGAAEKSDKNRVRWARQQRGL